MKPILLFGKLREDIGQDTIELPAFEGGSVADLRAALATSEHAKRASFTTGKILIAVNQSLVSDADPVNPGDEVALFPPVTGG